MIGGFDMPGTSRNLSRRQFLAWAGALSGGFMLPNRQPGSPMGLLSAPRSTERPVNVGLLLPATGANDPRLTDFASGLELGLQLASRADAPIALIRSAPAMTRKAVETAVQELIAEDGVRLIAGLLRSDYVRSLRPLLEQSRTVFVKAGTGAAIPRTRDQSAYVFQTSLGYWNASCAMGEWAVRHVGRHGLVISSMVDSGYDSLYAFRVGCESAGGSLHVEVAPDMNALASLIRQVRPDFVYAMYQGQQAVDFMSQYRESDYAGSAPLFGSSTMLDERVLPELGEAGLGVRSCFSWVPGLHKAEDDRFRTAYQQVTSREPDAFALLGYDTAMLVAEALFSTSDAPERLQEALAGASWSSPRGRSKMTAAHTASMPLYLREVRTSDRGLRNEFVGALASPDETDVRFDSLRGTPRTGWLTIHDLP